MPTLEQVTFPSRGAQVGELSGVLHLPDDQCVAGVVICHPYPPTSDMNRPVEIATAQDLSAGAAAALRFNFHSVGHPEPDLARESSELLDVAGAVDYLRGRAETANRPLYLCGRSFGASMALHWGVEDDRIQGIVAISTPLDWTDRQVIPRERLVRYRRPKLFIIGDRDELCSLAAHEALMRELAEPKESYIVRGADHYLSARAPEVAQVGAEAILRWARDVISAR